MNEIRWISVEEELPKTTGECLVHTDFGEMYITDYNVTGHYWDGENDSYITHWVYLYSLKGPYPKQEL